MPFWYRRALLLILGTGTSLGGYWALEHAPGLPTAASPQIPATITLQESALHRAETVVHTQGKTLSRQLSSMQLETTSLSQTASSLRLQIEQARAALAAAQTASAGTSANPPVTLTSAPLVSPAPVPVAAHTITSASGGSGKGDDGHSEGNRHPDDGGSFWTPPAGAGTVAVPGSGGDGSGGDD